MSIQFSDMIYFIKHIDIEGPGTLGEFFDRKGYVVKIIDLGAGDKLPESLKDVEAVIVLGGPMNVYEEDKYSFLREEDKFIKQVLDEGIPFMGICLGSQLLAKACMAKVGKSPNKEIGFSNVVLTKEGREDLLFHGIKNFLNVYQWHEDMFEIPQGAKLLAAAKDCHHQAIKVGSNAYGLQFHIEITDKSIKEWCGEYFKEGTAEHIKKTEEMLKEYEQVKSQYNASGNQIFENFLKIISLQKASV